MEKIFTLGLDEIDKLFLHVNLQGIILLRGNLAAGKTTLVKAIAKRLGIDEEITSPTFSVMQKYGENFYHYDIYNSKVEGFLSMGLLEMLSNEGLHVIEWGDDEFANMLDKMGFCYTCIDIESTKDKRSYKVLHV